MLHVGIMDSKKIEIARRNMDFYNSSMQVGMEIATDLIHSSSLAYPLKNQVKWAPWCPPPDGVIKVNFDATFKSETYQGVGDTAAVIQSYIHLVV